MPFSYSRTVRLADTDAAGVVYFTKMLDICHEAYEACLEDSGINLPDLVRDTKIALPIVHAEVDFFRPLCWGDGIQVVVTPQLISDAELTVHYKLTAGSELKAVALTRHVCIHSETRKRVGLPNVFQQWLPDLKSS
jgi:1,4-dihydroxy-2-naphthoyl-CoA hydrolase